MTATFGQQSRLLKQLVLRVKSVLASFPQGCPLDEQEWRQRHSWVLRLLSVQAVVLPLFGWLRGTPVVFLAVGGTALAGVIVLAMQERLTFQARAAVASFGLILTSALLVHTSGGLIEMHFHFFVMMSVIVLYQDWRPFLIALASVIIDHGLLGTVAPELVYNHQAAHHHPWM